MLHEKFGALFDASFFYEGGDTTMRCMVVWAHVKRTWMYAKQSAPRPKARSMDAEGWRAAPLKSPIFLRASVRAFLS